MLVPSIGYTQAAKVAKAALDSGQGVADAAVALGVAARDEIEELFRTRASAAPDRLQDPPASRAPKPLLPG
jgi:fumarate hydratase class II